MTLPFSMGEIASPIAAFVTVGGYICAAGLRGMSQPGLPLTDRRLIARYTLAYVVTFLLFGVIVCA